MPKRIIATLEGLRQTRTAKFSFSHEGIQRDGFVALHHGQVVAYENLCRHIPISIDYDDNQFYDKSGEHFVCRTHGAVYEPLTGLCTQGPCEGAKLHALQITVEEDSVFLVAPEC